MDANALYYTMSAIAQVAATGFAMSAAVALTGMQFIDKEIERTTEIFLRASLSVPGADTRRWVERLSSGHLKEFLEWFDEVAGSVARSQEGAKVAGAAASLGVQAGVRDKISRWLAFSGIATTVTVLGSIAALPFVPLVSAWDRLAHCWTMAILIAVAVSVFCYARLTMFSMWPSKAEAMKQLKRWVESDLPSS